MSPGELALPHRHRHLRGLYRGRPLRSSRSKSMRPRVTPLRRVRDRFPLRPGTGTRVPGESLCDAVPFRGKRQRLHGAGDPSLRSRRWLLRGVRGRQQDLRPDLGAGAHLQCPDGPVRGVSLRRELRRHQPPLRQDQRPLRGVSPVRGLRPGGPHLRSVDLNVRARPRQMTARPGATQPTRIDTGSDHRGPVRAEVSSRRDQAPGRHRHPGAGRRVLTRTFGVRTRSRRRCGPRHGRRRLPGRGERAPRPFGRSR